MDPVIDIIERSNQRGGRMLSVVDLVQANTVSVARAARMIGRLGSGSSLLVGARPGGAGKTTVMGAFLGMLPSVRAVRLADDRTGWERSLPGDLVVAYEIGEGDYEGYLWGRELRALTELGRAGVRIAANLHADTLEEARSQIVQENGAPEEGLAAFGMFVPLRVQRGARGIQRTVGDVLVAVDGTWKRLESLPCTPEESSIAAFLDEAVKRDVREIAKLRSAWLDAAVSGPAVRGSPRQPRSSSGPGSPGPWRRQGRAPR